MRILLVSVLTLSVSFISACTTIGGTTPTGSKVETCKSVTEPEIAALFDRWNNSLKTGDPQKVVANYDAQSILLPTVSDTPRITAEEKLDYFKHFLEGKPSGKINKSFIQIGCNTALDAGIYTFTSGTTGKDIKARYSYTYKWNGKDWLITSHHSSMMPEQFLPKHDTKH